MTTADWVAGRTETLPTVRPPRLSTLRLLGAAASAAGARAASRSRTAAGDLADVAGLGLITVGAFQLPGSWGEVGGWVVAGLSLLITGAKLNP